MPRPPPRRPEEGLLNCTDRPRRRLSRRRRPRLWRRVQRALLQGQPPGAGEAPAAACPRSLRLSRLSGTPTTACLPGVLVTETGRTCSAGHHQFDPGLLPLRRQVPSVRPVFLRQGQPQPFLRRGGSAGVALHRAALPGVRAALRGAGRALGAVLHDSCFTTAAARGPACHLQHAWAAVRMLATLHMHALPAMLWHPLPVSPPIACVTPRAFHCSPPVFAISMGFGVPCNLRERYSAAAAWGGAWCAGEGGALRSRPCPILHARGTGAYALPPVNQACNLPPCSQHSSLPGSAPLAMGAST